MSERRAMPAAVLVRMPPALAAAIRQASEAEGISDASTVRRILAATMQLPDQAQDTPRPRPAPSIDLLEVARLRHVLGELSGTLRQAAGLSRLAGQEANHAAIEALLPSVRATVAEVASIKKAMERRG